MVDRDLYLRTRAFLGILLLTVSTVACYHQYQRLQGDVDENSLIGKWTVTEDSVYFLRSRNICCTDKEIMLQLDADRSFELLNMPDAWIREKPLHSMPRETGTWSVKNSGDYTKLYLNHSGVIRSQGIAEKDGSIVIILGWGDPDSGNWIYFKKGNSQ